ncbi:MAG: hypothetical protein ABI833_08355 [Acidobacteriota bacterium]
MRTALLLLVSTLALADSAADVLNVFTSAAEALINDDAASFLDKFDRSTHGYATVQNNVEGLLAAYDVGSTIEEVSDRGDDQKRVVELDWLLLTSQKGATNSPQQTRRQVVKCTVERQGKRWKITSLEPTDFFRY